MCTGTLSALLSATAVVEVGMSDNTKADDLRGDKRNSERAIDLSTKSAMLRIESIEVDKVKEVISVFTLYLSLFGTF